MVHSREPREGLLKRRKLSKGGPWSVSSLSFSGITKHTSVGKLSFGDSQRGLVVAVTLSLTFPGHHSIYVWTAGPIFMRSTFILSFDRRLANFSLSLVGQPIGPHSLSNPATHKLFGSFVEPHSLCIWVTTTLV